MGSWWLRGCGRTEDGAKTGAVVTAGAKAGAVVPAGARTGALVTAWAKTGTVVTAGAKTGAGATAAKALADTEGRAGGRIGTGLGDLLPASHTA